MLKIPFIALIIIVMTISLLQAAPTNLQEERSEFLEISTMAPDESLQITVKTLSKQPLNKNVIHVDSVPLYSRADLWHFNESKDEMTTRESMSQQGKDTSVVDGFLNQPFGSITTTETLSDSTTMQPPQNFTLYFISDHDTINNSTEPSILSTEYGINKDGNSLSLPSTMQPVHPSTETTNNDSDLTISTRPPFIFKSFDDSLPETLFKKNEEQTTIRSDKAEDTKAPRVTTMKAEIAIEKPVEIVHSNVEIIEESQPKSNNEGETKTPRADHELKQTEPSMSLQEGKLVSLKNEAVINDVNFNVPIKEEMVRKENLYNEISKVETTASAQDLKTKLHDEIKEQLKEFQREITTKIAEETATTEVNEGNHSVQRQKHINTNFNGGLISKNDLNAFLEEYKLEETTTKFEDTPNTTERNQDITDVTVKDDTDKEYLSELPNGTEVVIKENHDPLEQPVQTIIEEKEEPIVVTSQDYTTTTDSTITTLSMMTEYVTHNQLDFGIDAKTETDVSQTTAVLFTQNISNEPTKVTESTSTDFTTTPDAISMEESTTEVELNIKPIHTTITEYTTTPEQRTAPVHTTTTEQPTTPVHTTTAEQLTTPVKITTTEQPSTDTQTTTEADSESTKSTTQIFQRIVKEPSVTNLIMATTELSQFKLTEPTISTTTSTTTIEYITTLGIVQETDQNYTVNVKLLNTTSNDSTTEMIYTTTKPIDVELQQSEDNPKKLLSETEEQKTNLEAPPIVTTKTMAVAPTTTISPTTDILNELTETTVKPIAVMPEARALNTPAPAHIERIFNEDGVEVIFGYSSVVRTNLD